MRSISSLLCLCKRLTSVIFNMSKKISIGTHNGTFHADEALACYMLKKIPKYSSATIIRSRDPSVLNDCDIVVDVGAIYDPSKHRYDHHQATFKHTMHSFRPNISSEIRLSSAGLIYYHFGDAILEAVMNKSLDKILKEKLFSYVYYHFIQEIDAIDNGIPMYEVGTPRFQINTQLSSRVAALHPPWNAKDTTCTMDLFEKAMALTGSEFENVIFRFRDEWWPAREIVQTAIDNRFTVDPSGEIIDIQYCPWKSHVFDIEEEQKIEGTIKYAIFHDSTGSWRACAVPLTPGNFILRVPLNESWRGIREEELQKVSEIPDAIFVHASGFIGGARSKEGALALVRKTLEIFHGHEKNNGNK